MTALYVIAGLIAFNLLWLAALWLTQKREDRRRDRQLASILSTERSAPRRMSGRGA